MIQTVPGVRHATVLAQITPQKALLIDPDYGLERMDLGYFLRSAYGKLLILGPPSLPR